MKTPLVKLANASGNLTKGAHAVKLGDFVFYFSFATCIGVQKPDGSLVARENEWGNVTARHLNMLDGGTPERKAARLAGDTFERELARILRPLQKATQIGKPRGLGAEPVGEGFPRGIVEQIPRGGK